MFLDVYFSGLNTSYPIRWKIEENETAYNWINAQEFDFESLNTVESGFCSSDKEADFLWNIVQSELSFEEEMTIEVVSYVMSQVRTADLNHLLQPLKNILFWLKNYERREFEGDISVGNAGYLQYSSDKSIPLTSGLTFDIGFGDLCALPNYADLDFTVLTRDASLFSRCGKPVDLSLGFYVNLSNIWQGLYGRLLEIALECKTTLPVENIFKYTGLVKIGTLVHELDFEKLKTIDSILKVEITD